MNISFCFFPLLFLCSFVPFPSLSLSQIVLEEHQYCV